MNATNQNRIILLSKNGMKNLIKSIHQLEHDRNRVLQFLREQDKTINKEENLKRVELLSNLENVELELAEKKQILSNTKLLPARRNKMQVAIGSVVELIDKYGHFYHYTIVDSIEANPSNGRISTQSPLGQSLLGRNVKDIVCVNSGKNFNQFQLVNIF